MTKQTMSARYIAGEAANAYQDASGLDSREVEKMGHSSRQAWRVVAEGDQILAFENLPGGLVRCWDEGQAPVDLEEFEAIVWARVHGEAWGKAAKDEACP